MNIRRNIAASVLLASICTAPAASARDRPGTPTDVFAGVFDTPLGNPPRVLLSFRNTATELERVSFYLEWTENGVPMSGDNLGGRLDCPTGTAQQYYCKPTTFYRHARVQGRAFTNHREFPHGVLFTNLKFDSEYCFRLIARDADKVFSEIWSAWTCTRTASPPPAPQPPEKVLLTFLPGSSGRGSAGVAVPPRALIEWLAPLESRFVAAFEIEQWVPHTQRWQSDDIERRGRVRVGGGGGPGEREVTIDLRAEVDQQSPPRFRVCSVNVAGRACVNAVAARLLDTAIAAQPISGARRAAESIAPPPEINLPSTQVRSAEGGRGPTQLSEPSQPPVSVLPVEPRDAVAQQTRERQVDANYEQTIRSIEANAAASDARRDPSGPVGSLFPPVGGTLVPRAGTVLHTPPESEPQAAAVVDGATPLQQSPLSKEIPPELAEQAEGKEILEMRCRGGGMFNFHQTSAQPPRFTLSFQSPKKDASGHVPPAGDDGGNLEESQCSLASRGLAWDDPVGIVFDASGQSSVQSYLEEGPAHFWRFNVFKTNYGHFRAVSHGPWTPQGAVAGSAEVGIPLNLFELDPATPLFVDGQQTTAGQVRQELHDQLRRASPPLAAPATVRAATKPSATFSQPSQPIVAAANNRMLSSPALRVDCTGQAPRILQVHDGVRAGKPFTVEGTCLGTQHGTLELIGLPTGKVAVPFTTWTENRIVASMPPVSGVNDQLLTLMVTRNPDRRTSAAREVGFEAAREAVRVPAERWIPASSFEKREVHYTGDDLRAPMRDGGTHQARVRVNAACALDGVAANPIAGAIRAIRGLENGPAHEGSISFDWQPVCVIRTDRHLPPAPDLKTEVTVCEVRFAIEATAQCPAGVEP